MRAAVPLRDDNGALTGAWPLGLLRRAMLEAGRRIGLADLALAVELTVDELAARLSKAGLHRPSRRHRHAACNEPSGQGRKRRSASAPSSASPRSVRSLERSP